MEKIQAEDLICMNEHARHENLRIELAYARADNLLFGERIYREDAQLWLHKTLIDVVLKAARALKNQNYRLILYDGLRTTDAQSRMLETQRVKDNPHWLEEPRLLSPPGAGAHPRAMAIDVSLETMDGDLLDMGTAFDFLAADSSATHNPAHRDYAGHSAEIVENRRILDDAMQSAADMCGVNLLLLPQEWWDFRLESAIYEAFEPLSDADLPPEIKMSR